MESVPITVRESRGVPRERFVIEQGVPVPPLSPSEVENLTILDAAGEPVPCDISIEGTDQDGQARWLLVTLPVSLEAGAERRFTLSNGPKAAQCPGVELQESAGSITISTPHLTLEFHQPDGIRLRTQKGPALDGRLWMDLRSDARSTVGGLRPAELHPEGFRVLERSAGRVRVLFTGAYVAVRPKAIELDPSQRYDVEAEFVVTAFSPVVRLRWRITDRMRFNCSYMWLDRYVLGFTLAQGAESVSGDVAPGGGWFRRWATVRTPGGRLTLTAPFADWIGRGAGVEASAERIGHGGICPPPDGGFGGHSPDIWRKFFNGMSRTFEGSLLLDASAAAIASELQPLPLILPPEHYSRCGELPESGLTPSFGPWKEVVDRAAQWLLDAQWKGTLWFGEWWREIDVDHNLGIEETNSGNAALAPLYHFYRTGDWRFWECAKLSYLYTWDVQFCKSEDGNGPYMHTRRFLLDHQEWFHPRYQRVGGVIKPSHLFADSRAREKVIWMLRWWADRYFDVDGAPMLPDRSGRMERLTERAMAIIGDSMALAYTETGDASFLDLSRRIGDWVVSTIAAEGWLPDNPGPSSAPGSSIETGFVADTASKENSNSTRYILQGLLPLCRLTGDPRYRDTYVRLAKWTLYSPRFEFGTHYFAFHFALASHAYRMSGDREILRGIVDIVKWVLSCESAEAPGTYPFLQRYQVPPARWICSYDNIAITAYLPVLASVLEADGLAPEDLE